jgi:CDGSH-type Zn-finger protein
MGTKMDAEKETKSRICVTKNGPYCVYGSIPLMKLIIWTDAEGTPVQWRTDKEYPLQKNCSLCRCGHSQNKPFCDGTHTRIGFDGTETADLSLNVDQAKRIDGPALRLTDAEDLCASARFCHRAAGIWNLVPQSASPEARRIAIEEAADCPSGRLVVCDGRTGKVIEPELKPSLGFVEDPQMGVSGPVWVRGGIPVVSADGKTYEIRNRVTLCRCGKSSNKPFCDSSHYPEEHVHEG